MDQIVNQAAKITYMFGGQQKFPIVYRASVGGGGRLAAQHSQSPYSMFMNMSGLKIILPSTPRDLKGLLKSAIRDNNPVISFEGNRLLAMKGEVPDAGADEVIPIGKEEVKRAGKDVTAWRSRGQCTKRWQPPRRSPRKASRSRSSTRAPLPLSMPRHPREREENRPSRDRRRAAPVCGPRPRSQRSSPRTRPHSRR